MENPVIKIFLLVIGSLASLGLLAGGIGYLLSKVNKGSREEKSDVISSADQLAGFWKEQVEGFRAVIAELTAKIEKQKDDHNAEMKKVLTELGEVRGRLGAETKAKEEYLAILQNRDPETKEFMKFMVKSVEDQGETHKELIRILGEIHTMAKAEHERDFKVTATVSKEPLEDLNKK